MDKTIITASTVTNIHLLFARYKEQFPLASEESFYRFLLAPTPERQIFLQKNCESTYIEHESKVIEIKLSVK